MVSWHWHGPEEGLATARPAERNFLWVRAGAFPAPKPKPMLLPRTKQKPFFRWPFAPARGLGDSPGEQPVARRHLQGCNGGVSASAELAGKRETVGAGGQCHGVCTSPPFGRLRCARREGWRGGACRGGARRPAFGAAR
jgi:hypothetical protein